MKKRIIFGFLLGTAVFGAVFASAATLGGINSGSLGADDKAVVSCDTNGVSVAYTVEYTNANTAGYKVKDLVVAGINDACDGAAISVTLTDTTGAALGVALDSTVPTGAATSHTISTGSTRLAEAVTGVSVVINGAPTTASI